MPLAAVAFRLALTALLVASFGGALAMVHRWSVQRRPPLPVAPAIAPEASSRAHSAVPLPVPAPEPAAIAPAIAEPEPARRPQHREIRAPVPTAVPPANAPTTAGPEAAASPADDSLTLETSMIDQALASLGQGQPKEALAAIGAYRQRFSHGKLEYEADLAEVKAQVALGKDAPALAVLDRAIAIRGFDTLPRSPDLSLLRAELLARTGDCAGALPALSRLLDGEHLEPALQERAVYGRAVCLGKLGQRAESRRALRDYLNRFPDGRFVKAAQDALDPLE